MDWDAVHAVMRARIAEGNPTPDAPRDSPQPGSEDDGAFTEVKSESEEGESDVAPTADEEETKPPPSLTHASESDEFHSAANSTDTKQNVIGVKRSGDVQDGGDTEARLNILDDPPLRRVRQEVQAVSRVSRSTTGRHVIKASNTGGARCVGR